MAKRHHVYQGAYNHNRRHSHNHLNTSGTHTQFTFDEYYKRLSRSIGTAWSALAANYVATATVLAVIVFSLSIPMLSHKMNATSEVKKIKQVLNMMENQVSQAEVACLTVADKIGFLHCEHNTETAQDMKDLSVCTSLSSRPTQYDPVHIQKKLDFFRRIFFPNRNTSLKEIALMSYVYTDSFDEQKNFNVKTNPDYF